MVHLHSFTLVSLHSFTEHVLKQRADGSSKWFKGLEGLLLSGGNGEDIFLGQELELLTIGFRANINIECEVRQLFIRLYMKMGPLDFFFGGGGLLTILIAIVANSLVGWLREDKANFQNHFQPLASTSSLS